MTPEQLAKQIVADLTKSVSESLKDIRSAMEKRIAEVETAFENRLAALPAPEKGDKGDPGTVDMAAVQAIIAEAVAGITLPIPEKGDKGDAGEVDMEAVQRMIADEVAKIDPPKGDKGDPGQVDMDAVQKLIADEVAKVELPQPDMEALYQRIDEKVAKLELPKGDKGDPGQVDMKAVRDIIAAEVKNIELPAPLSPLDLEILAGIDEEKSYPRSTYATHKGGLWRSFEKTKGMRGWECIVSGIAELAVDYDGERTVTITLSKTDGEAETKTVKIPVPLEKGIFRDTETYEKADMVTFSGAMWIALKDKPAGRPGISSDWRLSVKRGGTGKSAFDLARDAGFVGTKQEWLDSLGKKPIVKLPPE